MTHTGIAAPREPNRPAERRLFKVRGWTVPKKLPSSKTSSGRSLAGPTV